MLMALRPATTGTTRITRTIARLTATTAQAGLTAGSSSASAPGMDLDGDVDMATAVDSAMATDAAVMDTAEAVTATVVAAMEHADMPADDQATAVEQDVLDMAAHGLDLAADTLVDLLAAVMPEASAAAAMQVVAVTAAAGTGKLQSA